jgi:integrase
MLRKRGKYWHVQLKVKGKIWNRSTGETDLNRARRVEKSILEEARLRRDRPGESLSFDHAVLTEVARLETDVSKSAAERADYCFQSFQEWLGKDIPLNRIDTDLIEQFQRHRLKEVSLSTVTREIDNIVRLLKENGFIVIKPKRKPGKATDQRPLTDDELVKFFSHCNEDQKLLFQFLLSTGARPAEAIPSERSGHTALLKSELLTEENAVIIRSAKVKPGERGRIRKVIIPESLMVSLVEFAKNTPGPHVFLPNVSLCKLFDRICNRAGIAKVDDLGRKITAHSFRHTFGTKMAQATGGDQFILKATMGHSRITTTERYCHIAATTTVIDISDLEAKTA